jgi:hypothetical protein
MPETVHVTFLFALGQQVRWAERPAHVWRVIERHSREGTVSRYIRYRLMAVGNTEDAMAYEPDLLPEEDC